MHCEVLGWPEDGVTLRLDHREFGYAGKFVMSSTGKAVLHDRHRPASESHDDPVAASESQDDPPTASMSQGDSAAAFPGRDADEYATDVVAAVAFNEDRTDPGILWLRYVTVRNDRKGEGYGPRVLVFVRDAALERGYDRLRIAVNNPYSYEALYKTGFAYTGRETGIAELVLEHPRPTASRAEHDARYREGLETFAERDDLELEEEAFVEAKRERGPPEPIR